MGERIKELEEALATLHASVSFERHPLLRDELLKIKLPIEPNFDAISHFEKAKSESPSLPPELITSLGTLTIDEHGPGKYFGRSGGTEVGVYLLLSG